MEPDRELLRQYANDGNQAAFAEVVRRHTDLVYSAALRLVAGDAHLAQDVAQNVFTALARKAGTLAQRENLLGWLHTTTRYAASVAVRGERRRRTHEQEAGTTMHQDSATTEMDWMQLQPALDEAVGRLHAQDREAVLLRFFQGKSHREVGVELGVNEVLARKRVDRALEKLRVHLTRRGVTLSSALIAGAITTHSVQAAPAGLATQLGNAALTHAAHTGALASLLKGLTMTTKTKTTLAVAVVLAIAAIPVILQFQQLANVRAQNDDLAAQNADLEKSLGILKMQLKEAESSPDLDNALARTPADGVAYVPVKLDAIKNLFFTIDDGTFVLHTQTAGLLGLTPDETHGVQNVLDELQTRVLNYERANLKQVAFEDLPDEIGQDFLKAHPGKQSAYEIRPMTDDELAALQKWYLASLAKIIGSGRAQIVLSKSTEIPSTPPNPMYDDDMINHLWLRPGVRRFFLFSDYSDGKGIPCSSWYESYGPESGYGSTTSNAYPEILAPLFKELRANVHPTIQSQVLGNLHTIRDSALRYMLVHSAAEVSYQQLTGGPGATLKALAPIAGESYDDLTIQSKDDEIHVRVPQLGDVYYFFWDVYQ